MNFKDKKEKEIVADIKSLSERLSHVNNFSGLLMYQSEIQRFYEDFIFLKKLNSTKEGNTYEPETQETHSEPIQKPVMQTSVNISEREEEPVIAEPVQNRTNEEQKSKADDKINFNFSIQSEKKYKPLQIDLNDNIAFINYLFNGEKQEFETFIENLNGRNPVTSESYINHYIETKGWGKKHEEYIDRLSELNKQRFE